MRKWIYTAVAALALHANSAQACTDFILKSQDNACVVGRSMEFSAMLPTQIQIFPSGKKVQSSDSENRDGLSWTNKYSYIGLVYASAGLVMDGFNNQGLSVGALWLPGTVYPQKPAAPSKNDLFFGDVGAWLLGNFATVDEAKEALSQVNIYAASVPGFSFIPPIHLSIHDANGKSLVLEFLNGKAHLFDNNIGVLTNAPEFPWHVTNIRNYLNLSAINVGKIDIDGSVLEPIGQGSGLMGIPGDWTPPSRFVRATIFKQAITPPKNARDAVVAAIHILNTVDIPHGAIRSANSTDSDYTQWVVIKDLTNKKLFYRTYRDQNIAMADLNDPKVAEKPIELNLNP